jgi:hypothetical protein
MKHVIIAIAILFTTTSLTAQLVIDDISVEKKISVQNQELVLNGAGQRTSAFFDLYVGALYTPSKTSNAQAIINEDKPLAITLDITSRLVSQGKMIDAVETGFEDSCSNKERKAISKDIKKFIGFFNEEIVMKDHFEIAYIPGKGTLVSKNGKEKGVIASTAFKKCLFSIWLGDEPVDADLKSRMLGK